MDSERIKELQKPLMDALQRLQQPIEIMSLVAIANEFYTPAQRVELYAQHQALVDADDNAFQLMNAARPQDELSREDRVKMLGKQVADEQMAPYDEARAKRVQASKDLSDFRKEHGLIVRLLEQKVAFAKRDR